MILFSFECLSLLDMLFVYFFYLFVMHPFPFSWIRHFFRNDLLEAVIDNASGENREFFSCFRSLPRSGCCSLFHRTHLNVCFITDIFSVWSKMGAMTSVNRWRSTACAMNLLSNAHFREKKTKRGHHALLNMVRLICRLYTSLIWPLWIMIGH